MILTLALALQLTVAPNPECALTPDEAETLRDLKTRHWPAIYAAPDPAALEAFLHPQFQMIDGAGGISKTADEVAYLRTKAPDPSGRRFTYRIERLEVFPNCTAVISGQGRVETLAGDGRRRVATYRSSNVLIKVDGMWRPIASHVSGETQED